MELHVLLMPGFVTPRVQMTPMMRHWRNWLCGGGASVRENSTHGKSSRFSEHISAKHPGLDLQPPCCNSTCAALWLGCSCNAKSNRSSHVLSTLIKPHARLKVHFRSGYSAWDDASCTHMTARSLWPSPPQRFHRSCPSS